MFSSHVSLKCSCCFWNAFGEEVSIFRKQVNVCACLCFLSAPWWIDLLSLRLYIWRLLTDARVCASLKCTNTENRHTRALTHPHRDEHTNTAGPSATSPSSLTTGTCNSLGKVIHSSSKSLPESHTRTRTLTHTHTIPCCYVLLSSPALRSRAA